jgi:hypothetical protein
MKTLCMISALAFLALFAALNLFLPYAILVIVLAIAIGFPCKIFRRSRDPECRLGYC